MNHVDLTLLYLLFVFALSAALIYRRSTKTEKRNTFPVWGPIEIAVTSLIVSKGGIAFRI
jgi:hypothetical protein